MQSIKLNNEHGKCKGQKKGEENEGMKIKI